MSKYLNITNWTEFFDNLFPIALNFNDNNGNGSMMEFPLITEDMLDMIDKNNETGVTILSINIDKWLPDDDNSEWDDLDCLINFLQKCKQKRDAAVGV